MSSQLLTKLKSQILQSQLSDLEKFRILTAKLKLKYILDPKKEDKRKSIPAPLKKQIWEKYISIDLRKGKCFCCKTTDIMESDFHAGHIISDKDKGKVELENLRPLCSKCNLSMGSENMFEFISKYGFWN